MNEIDEYKKNFYEKMAMNKINNFRTSKHDNKEYLYIKLWNSMKCLLIHDNTALQSGACLVVGSGSLCDP